VQVEHAANEIQVCIAMCGWVGLQSWEFLVGVFLIEKLCKRFNVNKCLCGFILYAEAIKKILGQDPLRKKQEDKLRKQRYEKEQVILCHVALCRIVVSFS